MPTDRTAEGPSRQGPDACDVEAPACALRDAHQTTELAPRQLAMLDDIPGPLARRSDAPTSSAAGAAASDPERLNRQMHLVLAVLAAFGRSGATDAEIAERARMHIGSAAKRRNDLQTRGLVEETGTRRRTPHGRMAVVHRLTLAGSRIANELHRAPAAGR